jgi:hypothetical protein
MLTLEEAKRCVAIEKPDHGLSEIATGRYVLVRPDGTRVGYPGDLVAVLVGADIPIPVRDEGDATAVVRAKTRSPLGCACEGMDGEKVVGLEALLQDKGPDGRMASDPWHHMGRVLGRGKTWNEALAQFGVRTCG